MKDFYVKDAATKKTETVTSFFVVVSIQARTKKDGSKYVALVLADRTGRIDAKLWDLIEQADGIACDDIVKVEARVLEYQGKPDLVLHLIRKADPSEFDLSDFLPATTYDVAQMWDELLDFVQSVQHPQIRRVLQAVVEDAQISSRFKTAPAAVRIHHAFLGGLLEHVVSLCRLASSVQQNYSWINRDLLIAGAILHDIGKVQELAYERAFRYTDEGRLTGHIAIGLKIIRSAMDTTEEVSPGVSLALEHLVLSHHGELQYGSPVQPQLPEALLFHLLDNVDAKVASMWTALASCATDWTERVPGLDRQILRTERLIEEEKHC